MNKRAHEAERRRHTRISANFVISYRVKEVHEHYDLSQTKNVSQGGILLTTNKKFGSDVQLAITIRFPFIPKRIEVTGQVIDSKEVVRDLIYETRIKFLDLDREFFEKLGEYVKNRLN